VRVDPLVESGGELVVHASDEEFACHTATLSVWSKSATPSRATGVHVQLEKFREEKALEMPKPPRQYRTKGKPKGAEMGEKEKGATLLSASNVVAAVVRPPSFNTDAVKFSGVLIRVPPSYSSPHPMRT